MDRRPRLALDEMKRAGLLHDDIDLDSPRLPVMLEIGLPPPMKQRFQDLSGYPAFKQRTPKRVTAKLIRVPNAEKTASHAGIDETRRGGDEEWPSVPQASD